MTEQPLVIDASDHILGRLAIVVAKRALSGERVVIVNVEKAVITGRKQQIIERARHALSTRTHQSQERAPKHPRRPDLYARRVVRGMLPWKKSSGKVAFKKVQVYMGVPEKFSSMPMRKISEADASKLQCSHITLGELSRHIVGSPQ